MLNKTDYLEEYLLSNNFDIRFLCIYIDKGYVIIV